MTFEPHPQNQLRTTPLGMALYLFGSLVLFLLAYVTVSMEIEPFWVFFAVPVALLLPVLVQRFPVFLMVAMVYVGTLKTRGGVGVSMFDPTLVTTVLLYGAIILQVLLLAVGAGGRSLRELFAGQKGGVCAFCFLVLVIAISYSYTPAPDIGGAKVLRLIAFDTPLFLAPLMFLRTDRDVRQFVLLSMLGSLFLACRTMYRVLHPTVEVLLGEEDPTQIGEGLLMGAAALMALYYPFQEKRVFQLVLTGVAIALTCGTTASLSRSAVLALLLVGAASLMFLRRSPGMLSRRALLSAGAAVVITVSVATVWLSRLPATHSKIAAKASELRLTLQGTSPPGGTAGQRYSFSGSAWQAFLSKPLLGWGAGGWSTLWHYDDERVAKYPHDFVLEIAAEQGIVGLAALGLLLLAVVRASVRVLKDPKSQFVYIVPVVALSLLGNAVTGQVDDRGMWLFCGTLLALARMVGSEPLIRRYNRSGVDETNLQVLRPC